MTIFQWFFKSLSRQVSALLVLILFVVLLSFAYFFYDIQAQSLHKSTQQMATQLLSSINTSNAKYLHFEDYFAAWQDIKQQLKNNQEQIKNDGLFKITEIALVDINGNTFAHSDPANHPIKQPYNGEDIGGHKKEIYFEWKGKNGLDSVRVHKNVYFQGREVGEIILQLDLSLLKFQLNNLVFKFSIFITIILFLTILIGVFFGRWISSPVKAIEASLKNMGTGQLNLSSLHMRHDEMLTLALSIEQADKNLYLSQGRVHLLLDSTAEAIYGIDENGKCTFVNKACLKMLGYDTEDELLGKEIHPLFHSKKIDGSVNHVQDSKILYSIEHKVDVHSDAEVILRKDGTLFSAEYWSHPIFSNNQCVGAVVTFFDITERLQSQKALQERENNLAITLNSIGDAVITTDAKGLVERMNPIAISLTGWSPEEAIGLPLSRIFSIINSTTREVIPNPVERVLSTGETVYLSNHTTLISRDGTEYHIADSAAPIKSEDDNEIKGMVLVFNDVTDQYQLREKVRNNQRLMQGLMDDLKSMVGIMQPNGCISYINCMPLIKTGIDKADVIGEFLWDCVWFKQIIGVSEQVLFQCKKARKGESSVQDIQFQTSEKRIWMELGVYPVLDDNGTVVQIVFEGVDISQRKAAETLQKNYQVELEVKVNERTLELKQKAEELARATQLKSEFLANMSHELRTPMNSIIGFTGRVIKKSADKLDERQLNNLRTVERNAHHLLELINGLLDLSKIEAGKMDAHAEIFDLGLLVKEVFSLTHPMLEGKSVVLVTTLQKDEIQLNTDIIKLKQVLINLVSNAIKFTQSGSVTISAEIIEDQVALKSNHTKEPVIAIRVTDTGVGMSESALQYIFDAFRQVDGTLTRKAGGTGLGLAIVNSFTELLRGKVSVESEVDSGTTFTITLPVNLDVADKSFKITHLGTKLDTQLGTQLDTQQDSQLTTNDTGEKQTILCIDDELEALDLLASYLTDEGYHVLTAYDAEQGVLLAKEKLPFAITLDILMPHKDGWSVLSELKADNTTKNIPVFIISFLDNQALGYQLGAFDFMQKPVKPERLIGGIKRLDDKNMTNILVVDDDPEAQELMKQILDDVNLSCQCVSDGQLALDYLSEPSLPLPQLIVLDLMMPNMDGFEFLRLLQQKPLCSDIPVIVVTAKTLEEHEREFLRPRVTSILAKAGLTSEVVLKQLSDSLRNIHAFNNESA